MFVISGHIWSTSNRNNLSLGSGSSLFWCRWQYYNYFSCKSRYLYRKLHTFVTLRHTDLPVDCYLSRYMYTWGCLLGKYPCWWKIQRIFNWIILQRLFFFCISRWCCFFILFFLLYLCRLRKATCPIKSPLDLNLKS